MFRFVIDLASSVFHLMSEIVFMFGMIFSVIAVMFTVTFLSDWLFCTAFIPLHQAIEFAARSFLL